MPEITSHNLCWTGDRYDHLCHKPSGWTCVEHGCEQPAGTYWGPYWCPDHDVERLDRIGAGLADILGALGQPEGGDSA